MMKKGRMQIIWRSFSERKERRGAGWREGGREREKVEGVGGKGRSEERRVGRKKRGKRAWRKGGREQRGKCLIRD